MNNPLISVIITTQNRKELVVKAIDSVLKQSYKNTEIIVLDDASTDETFEVISELSQKYSNIVAIKNDSKLGFVDNHNKGISLANGYYIAILNDDDIWANSEKNIR